MAPQSSVQEMSLCKLLTKQLSVAVKRKGNITLSNGTISKFNATLKSLRTNQENLPEGTAAEVVSLLDGQDGNCSRLETKLFVAILKALLQTAYSRHKERGLLLLAASLYDEQGENDALEKAGTRATALGRDTLRLLLTSLVDTAEQPRSRRWIGVLLYQLLEKSDENIFIFQSCPEDSKRKLGTMIAKEKNEILRAVCGQILRVLMSSGISPQDIWPVGTDPVIYSGFPRPQQSENSWNREFQSYVDSLFEMTQAPDDIGALYFAHSVTVFPSRFQISGKSNIMFLVGDEVSICAQFSSCAFGGSLDFPFDLIVDVAIQEVIFESGKKLAVAPFNVVIKLSADEAICCINGKPMVVTEVQILVSSKTKAVRIREDLLQTRSSSKASQTYDPIDMGISSSAEDASLSQGSKSSMCSKASRAGDNIIILAHDSATLRQNDGMESLQSIVPETLSSTLFQRGCNRISDLLPADSPIFARGEQIPCEVQGLTPRPEAEEMNDPLRSSSKRKSQYDGSTAALMNDTLGNGCCGSIQYPGIQEPTIPGKDTAKQNISQPTLSRQPSERSNGESTDDPIGFLPSKVVAHQPPKKSSNPSKKWRTGAKGTALIPEISSGGPNQQVTHSVSLGEQKTSAPNELFQKETAKSEAKLDVSTRGISSLDRQQDTEANTSCVKPRDLKKVKKYSLNFKPIPKAGPKNFPKAVPVTTPKTLNANDTVIWDVPTDPAETGDLKSKEATKAKVAPKKKIEAKVRPSIGCAKRKNGTARKKRSAPDTAIQPGPTLRSKRKAAQAANSKLQEADKFDDDGDGIRNDTIMPKGDGVSKSIGKEAFGESKVAEKVKAKQNCIERGSPRQLAEGYKSTVGTQKPMERTSGGATKRIVGAPPVLPTFGSDDLEVVPSYETLEKQFQLQKQDAIVLGFINDNFSTRDEVPISTYLDPSKVGSDSGGRTIRHAQRLAFLLMQIDSPRQPEINDQQSNFSKTQILSTFRCGTGLESNSMLEGADSWDFIANGSDPDELLEPSYHGDRGSGPVVETGRNASKKEDLGRDAKELQPKDDNATHPFLSKVKPIAFSKFAGESGLLGSVSIQEKQIHNNPVNEQVRLDLTREEGAKGDSPSNLVSKSEELHPQSPILSRDKLSTPSVSPIRRKRLLPQKTQTPPSRSPRLLECVKEPSMIPETAFNSTANPSATLVNEYLARKTPLVGFGIGGAQNQGFSSNQKASITQVRVLGKSLPLPESVRKTGGQFQEKRGRIDGDILEPNEEQPRSKIQKIQKIRKAFHSNIKTSCNSGVQNCFSTSEQIPVQKIPRLGSQSSRVDPNGSPRALNTTTDVERRLKFREITKKLVRDLPPKNMNTLDELPTEIEFADDGQAFFDDEPILSSNAKSYPLSPLAEGGGITRYIPHKKTTRGDYIEITTKEIVPVQQIPTDPFLKKCTERNLSEFTRRLQAGRSMQISKSPQYANNVEGITINRFSVHEDSEKTLVDEQLQEALSSPGDMTSESSDRSQDSQQPSSPINFDINDNSRAKWAAALKPHYKGMRETLIRIVDDIVRNLIDQEPAIDDVLRNYHQGGTKLVEHLSSEQKEYIRRTEGEVYSMMDEMTRIYKESRREILQGMKKMKASSLDQAGKKWRQEQQALQILVEEGRKQIKKL